MLDKLIDVDEIAYLVEGLGSKITLIHDPCIWIVMDGAFMFAADLLRASRGIRSTQFFFVDRGYGQPTGPHDPHIYHVHHEPVFLTKYSHVIVDVVVEEGRTFQALLDLVPERQRPSVTTCALVVKGTDFTPTIFGKRVDKVGHLTGYGMGPYRNLPHISVRRER